MYNILNNIVRKKGFYIMGLHPAMVLQKVMKHGRNVYMPTPF